MRLGAFAFARRGFLISKTMGSVIVDQAESESYDPNYCTLGSCCTKTHKNMYLFGGSERLQHLRQTQLAPLRAHLCGTLIDMEEIISVEALHQVPPSGAS